MCSIVSLIVLLLAACCYSLPVDKSIESFTSTYQQTGTDSTIINGDSINVTSLPEQMKSDESKLISTRTDNQLEYSTSGPFNLRLADVLIDNLSWKDLTSEASSTDSSRNERNPDSFYSLSTSTMESATQFSARAIFDPSTDGETKSATHEHKSQENDDREDKVEVDVTTKTKSSTSSTILFEEKKDDPSTSVDSFGRLTGLLYEQTDATSTTSKPKIIIQYETEESMSSTKKGITSDKMSEMKVTRRVPSKSTTTTEQSQEEAKQLSQGEKQSNTQKTKSNY